MATYKKTIKNYYFKKPEKLSRSEYDSLKQAMRFNPDFDFYTSKPFWKEFEMGLYFLVAIIAGLPLAIVSETFSFIPGIGFGGLIFFIIFNFESMLNYSSYLKRKKLFFQKLRTAIGDSYDYEDYKTREKILYR